MIMPETRHEETGASALSAPSPSGNSLHTGERLSSLIERREFARLASLVFSDRSLR